MKYPAAKQTTSATTTRKGGGRDHCLTSLPHHKPLALFVAETECPHRGGFGCLRDGSLDIAKELAARSNARGAPGAGGLPYLAGREHCLPGSLPHDGSL